MKQSKLETGKGGIPFLTIYYDQGRECPIEKIEAELKGRGLDRCDLGNIVAIPKHWRQIEEEERTKHAGIRY